MKLPVIIVNAKAYSQGIGAAAERLAKLCAKAAKETGVMVALAVQPSDIGRCAAHILTLAQHVDATPPGAHTGAILPEAVKAAGASGTLLNHSERRIPLQHIMDGITICRRLKLATVLCAATPAEAEELVKAKPDFIAVEPPELIAGKISVSQARPEVISEAVERIRKVPVLVGAGIQERRDVEVAAKLGAKGILVASGVVLAKDPYHALVDLAEGF